MRRAQELKRNLPAALLAIPVSAMKLHRMMHRRFHLLMLLFLGSLCGSAMAQIDPEQRRLFQLGYNQPLETAGPLAAYAFYYHNQPGFIHTNLTLRLSVAPVYLDSELGVKNALGPRTDLGFGIAGGGFADSYAEVGRGDFLESESFWGHGAELSTSLYHLFNPNHQIPLHGIVRAGFHLSYFEEDNETAETFELPADHGLAKFRTGLRWGGRAPRMITPLALEVSAFYDAQYRTQSRSYGFNNDRELEQLAHLFWLRGLIHYTCPDVQHRLSLSLTGGTSVEADRLNAYRIGGLLPFTDEFTLNIPGYFVQELTAENFVLANAEYAIPIDEQARWEVSFFGATGLVDYLNGLEQSSRWHSGLGGGITYRSPLDTVQIMLVYGHGFNALRSGNYGANSIGILCQIDLEARKEYRSGIRPSPSPNKLRGLDWLFGR